MGAGAVLWWADRIREWDRGGGNAVRNALTLRGMLGV